MAASCSLVARMAGGHANQVVEDWGGAVRGGERVREVGWLGGWGISPSPTLRIGRLGSDSAEHCSCSRCNPHELPGPRFFCWTCLLLPAIFSLLFTGRGRIETDVLMKHRITSSATSVVMGPSPPHFVFDGPDSVVFSLLLCALRSTTSSLTAASLSWVCGTDPSYAKFRDCDGRIATTATTILAASSSDPAAVARSCRCFGNYMNLPLSFSKFGGNHK